LWRRPVVELLMRDADPPQRGFLAVNLRARHQPGEKITVDAREVASNVFQLDDALDLLDGLRMTFIGIPGAFAPANLFKPGEPVVENTGKMSAGVLRFASRKIRPRFQDNHFLAGPG